MNEAGFINTYGACIGKINTLPNRNYLVTINKKDSLVNATVLAKGYLDFRERSEEGRIGFLICNDY